MPGVLREPVWRGEDPELRTCVLPRLSGQDAGQHQLRRQRQGHDRLPRLSAPDVHQEAEGSAAAGQAHRGRADPGGASSDPDGGGGECAAHPRTAPRGERDLGRLLLQGDLRARPSAETDQPRTQRVPDLYHKRRGATHGRGRRAHGGGEQRAAAAQAEAPGVHHRAVPVRSAVRVHHPRARSRYFAVDFIGVGPV